MTFKNGDIVQIRSYKQIRRTFDGFDGDGDGYIETDLTWCDRIYFNPDMQCFCGQLFEFRLPGDDDPSSCPDFAGYNWHPKWLKRASAAAVAAHKQRLREAQRMLRYCTPGQIVRVRSLKEIQKLTTADTDGARILEGIVLDADDHQICGKTATVIDTDSSDSSVLVDAEGVRTWLHALWLAQPSGAELRKIRQELAARAAALTAMTDRQRAAIEAVKAGRWGCQTEAVQRLVSVLADLPDGAFRD